MSLAPGTRLGTYEIISPIGVGGMGEVYRARDTRLGREVAVKVLPQAVASSTDRLARFEREARTVAGLNHPNIVTLFSVEDEEGVGFLTMELVEGQSLDRLIASGGFPLARVLDLGIPLANALSAAHERGVVHRDLKPSNVMVARDGWLKVLDFGLAKVAADDGRDAGATIGATADPISGVGQVLGTVPYMSPEQVRGEVVDARSDLFSLGIILYELATGRRPFVGSTPADVSSAILRDVPAPVITIRGDLPRDLDRIITRCLEKNPRDRIQTARDVYNELRYLKREIERGAMATSTPASSSGVSSSQAYAPPTPSPVSAAPSSAPASAASGSSSLRSGLATPPPKDVPSIAVLPFVNRSRGEEDEYFSDGLADELLNVLTKIRGLRVAARASSFQFKGKNEDLAVIGEKLNVATLLDGSVRKAGNRVRISVQLIKASDRVQLWSETYDRSLEDIFAVQDDIAQSVVKELRTTLLGASDSDASGSAKAEVAVAAKGHGTNPEAHRLFLQGKHLLERVTEEDTKKGIQYLQEAIALDPSHAAAWAEMAKAYGTSGGYGWIPVKEAYGKAKEAVKRALDLDSDLAEAYVRLCTIQRMFDWDWKAAEESARRALQLAPGNTFVLATAGSLAHQLGRLEEAESLLRRAVEQDPLNAAAYGSLGQVYRTMNRLSDAERCYWKALELAPHRVGSRLVLSIILMEQGKLTEAFSVVSQEPAEWARLTGLACVHWRSGRKAEAMDALRVLEEKHAVDSPYQIAAVYAIMGDIDAAFAWANRGVDERDSGMSTMRIESVFRALHDDPRWPVLMKRLGFES